MDISKIKKRIMDRINYWEPRFDLSGTELIILDMLIQYAFVGYNYPININMNPSISSIDDSKNIYKGVYIVDPLLMGWNEYNDDKSDYSFYSSATIEKDVVSDCIKILDKYDDNFVYSVIKKQANIMLTCNYPEILPMPPAKKEPITFKLNSSDYLDDMVRTFRMYDDIECHDAVETGWIYCENLYIDNWSMPFINIMNKIKSIANEIDNSDYPKEFSLESLATKMDTEFPNIGKIISIQCN